LLVLFVLLYLYIAEALGRTLDPTLDEGLLIPVLIITIAASVVYFSIMILTNIYIWKKTPIKKFYFILIIFLSFLLGFISNQKRIDILFN
jgi:hypothetical protein